MKISIIITKGELIVYPEKRIIHHIIKEPMNHQELEDLLTKGLELFSQYNCHKWLSDDRNSVIFDDKFLKWASIWESKIMKLGWKAWAFLPPKDQFCKTRMEENKQRLGSMGVKIKDFDNTEAAMAWLEKQ